MSSRRWDFSLATESNTKGGRAEGPSSSHLPKPPGFVEHAEALAAPTSATLTKAKGDVAKLKVKKAWEVAFSPGPQFAMNAFMLWMSGNQPNIFSIMITSYVMYNPIKAIFGAGQTFARFGDGQTDVTLQKITFVLLNAAVCGFGVLKMSWLGLLPTEPADWIAFYSVRTAAETATGGVPLGQ
ncbi:hypothetical protein KFE25_004738 [Diacronema lutheri]|uniref:ER membrane protein complex subunit 4 n=2 Tax=Diacronema lutheri TaxID=2081491 RepID=A0A8J5XFA2_DIALT|nr:hypothetical protein KFE25_004738 [Diacronema lutheri]